MKTSTFVIGGCRSGKSGYAQQLAEKTAQTGRMYIATCIPYDDEMKDRVKKHREDRDETWSTIEAPTALPQAILEQSRENNVLLVDCLTLWTTNLLLDETLASDIPAQIEALEQAIEKAGCPVILVSNEVGAGIVPENDLARAFRDWVGFINQRVAACVNRVVWSVAGIPVTIKGENHE